jgi:ureidoacrylate peracid hydrolase
VLVVPGALPLAGRAPGSGQRRRDERSVEGVLVQQRDWDMTRSTGEKHDVVGHLKQAVEGARQRRLPVLFGPMAYTAEDYDNEELQRRSGINRVMFERKMFLAGSWGADFHPELRPAQDEIILLPHKGVDVFETDLPEHLDRWGITHL